jgi:hypothetical protein
VAIPALKFGKKLTSWIGVVASSFAYVLAVELVVVEADPAGDDPHVESAPSMCPRPAAPRAR